MILAESKAKGIPPPGCTDHPQKQRFLSWEETFGTVTIEAMASGVPVIGSNTAGTAEILGNETFLFQPKNPEDLSAKLLKVLQEDTLRANWAVDLQHKFQNKYTIKTLGILTA